MVIKNKEGDSPFHVGMKHNSTQTMNKLLDSLDSESEDQRRKILNQQNKEGDTILHLAYQG